MSTVVDDPVVDPPEVSDEEILSRCREIEVARRAMLAAPRVGISVAEQIDDVLDHAANLSFLAFEQYVIA